MADSRNSDRDPISEADKDRAAAGASDSGGDDDSPLNCALADYMARIDRGETVDREEFVRNHPEAADELRAYFADEKAIAGVMETAALRQAGSFVAPSPFLPGQQLGDYQIVREIARGGMGIVYEAKQRSLQRTVAIKLILKGQLASESDIERFRREAEMAANLRHPNIVAVHEIGEHAGYHYFAMDYIAGCGLEQIARGKPLSGKKAAQYLLKVADAIRCAHAQGILHRDLKPSNILIDAGDEPHVSDFGLAKRLEDDSQLTAADMRLGSPSYMSPEQAGRLHAEVGPATDIYGLGATLYELLTGRPPFRAETPALTILQVLEIEPAPPRLLNANVDRDVETICLKCLEKEPSRRYESVETLIDDLRHYLADEPIHARPVGVVGRLRRWCRRNPLVASLSAATVLLLVFGLVATSVGYIRATRAEKAATQAKERATEEQQRAENNERRALGAVRKYFTTISENRLLNEPGMQLLRKELLLLAKDDSEQLLEENRKSSNRAMQAELALAHYRLGVMAEELTDKTDAMMRALDEYKKARELQEGLLGEMSGDVTFLEAYGRTLNALGSLCVRLGAFKEAAEAYDGALAARTKVAGGNSPPENAMQLLANTEMNLGLLTWMELTAAPATSSSRTEIELARAQMNTAQQRREQLIAEARDQDRRLEIIPDVRHDLAMGYYNLARVDIAEHRRLQVSGGRASEAMEALQDAEKHLKSARKVFKDLEQDYPADAIQYERALCDRLLALVRCRKDPHSAWLEDYDRVCVCIKELAGKNPSVPKYQLELAQSYVDKRETAKRIARFDPGNESVRVAIAAAHQEARKALETLVRHYPKNVAYRKKLILFLLDNIREPVSPLDDCGAYSAAYELYEHLQAVRRLVPNDANTRDLLGFTTNDLLVSTTNLVRQLEGKISTCVAKSAILGAAQPGGHPPLIWFFCEYSSFPPPPGNSR
jgi:tRNA A-37 threonylcarbamoyl transferase component Bud32/tetratricopeptide (TPR) repeat protein